MALDKRSIERQDFPVGRRGYERQAVDAHLSWLANQVASERASLAAEVEELKRAPVQEDPLASTASEDVRSIVAAAESSAAEIQSAAESSAAEIQSAAEGDARRVRDRADADSQATRERAAEQVQQLVDKVSEVTSEMLERISSMESELGSVIGSVRSGCERLAAELERLRGNLGDVAELHASGPQSTNGHSTAWFDEVAAEDESGLSADEADGARLIALNMALTGTPRGETARYLRENFSLPDADRLLDDVYSGVDS